MAYSAQVTTNKVAGRMTPEICPARTGASIHANDRATVERPLLRREPTSTIESKPKAAGLPGAGRRWQSVTNGREPYRAARASQQVLELVAVTSPEQRP